jgi:steroid 5-alpha reductase family enzyme
VTALSLVLLALAALCGAFVALYFLARRLDNYGIVDVAWAYAFAPVAWFYAAAGPGWLPRRILVASFVTLWAARLGTHLLRRVASHHPIEDGRYVQLRRDWAGNFAPKMAGFFQLQAASIVLLAVPFLLPVLNPGPTFQWLEMLGAALWIIALAGEAIADAQLAAFKRNPAHRGRVCDVGLWRYSRHPNYFFEWLVWVAFAAIAFGSPWGWLALIAPAAILHLLLRVTGIPLNEEQSLRSKGDAYRRYQQTTSAFVPWPPRTEDRGRTTED